MVGITAYRLIAKGPLHFGERGIGLEETSIGLHADTIFSALCLTLREMGKDLEPLLSAYPRISRNCDSSFSFTPGTPPFTISSAFPFAGNVYLFPRPLVPINGLKPSDIGFGKAIKKIQYVSMKIFESLLEGNLLRDSLITDNDDGKPGIRKELLFQNGHIWISDQELSGLPPIISQTDLSQSTTNWWAINAAPRVTIDRATSKSSLFATGQVRFSQGCGLYFLTKYNNIEWKEKIETALNILQDSGIGGERTTGHGQFNLEIIDNFPLTQPDPEDRKGYLTLSPFWPTKDEVDSKILDNAHYGLFNRRGWVTSPDAMGLRRQNVRMLTEGSIFHSEPVGALVDVNPIDFNGQAIVTEHDIWRYGLAFPVACLV